MNNDLTQEQFFEDLAKQCPELMEKATIEYFAIGKGWNDIIRVLCNCIYEDLYRAKSMLRAAREYPRDQDNTYIKICEAAVLNEIESLPSIKQVKEKFGTLRVYVDGGTERTNGLVRFAESMSAVTCEVCGNPGQLDQNGGWIKTHCTTHRKVPDTTSAWLNARNWPNFFTD